MKVQGRRLRVASSGDTARYVEALYRPVRDEVDLVRWPVETWYWNHELRAHLAEVDLVHLHWPENRFGLTPANHRAAAEAFREAGVPVVWTAHDAVPHNYEPGDRSEIYQIWADFADGVIHNSAFGMSEMMRLYRFRPEMPHRVIHLPHWGSRVRTDGCSREEAERQFGLPQTRLRVGVHASPRPAKDVQLALDAFAACSRQDMQLFVTCLNGETVPDDPRIVAFAYTYQSMETYKRALLCTDLFLLPFRRGFSTLSTGTVMDAVALGKPMLVSDWPYFAEVAGEAGICYGSSRDELIGCLNALDASSLARATEASEALQKARRFKHAAAETLQFLREVLEAC